jgi:hypothetical protein
MGSKGGKAQPLPKGPTVKNVQPGKPLVPKGSQRK